MSELGVVFDTMGTVASEIHDVTETLSTGKQICDGAVIALDAASVFPPAAAVAQPIANIYRAIEPILDAVINLLELIDDYVLKVVQLIQQLDQVCQGKFNSLAGEPLTPMTSPISF